MYKLIKGNFRDFSATIAKYPKSDLVGFHTSDDLSLFSCLVWTEGEVILPGEVREVIKEIIKRVEVEVIKEVDNPKHLTEIEVLKDKLADALNAEQVAKKEAADLKKQIPKLKASVEKLKKALTED